jgi:hypothetical protein
LSRAGLPRLEAEDPRPLYAEVISIPHQGRVTDPAHTLAAGRAARR